MHVSLEIMLSLFDDLSVASVALTRSRINHIMIFAILAAMPELEKNLPQEGGRGQETAMGERKRFENPNIPLSAREWNTLCGFRISRPLS